MKAMKTSTVLKMLAGAATAALTVTGIAVSVTNGSSQNMADVSAITEEGIQVAEAIANSKLIIDEVKAVENAAEETITKPKYIVDDKQSTDEAPVNVQSDNTTAPADRQKSDIVKESDTVQKPDAVKESDIVEEYDIEQQSDAVEESVPAQSSDVVKESAPAQQPDTAKESAPAQQPNTVTESAPAQQPDTAKESAPVQQPNTVTESAPAQQPNTVTESAPVQESYNPQQSNTEPKSDIPQQSEESKDIDEQAAGGGGNMCSGSVEVTLTGIVEGISKPEEDDDCVVGHRYCVCGAAFDIRKNSGLDNGAWMAHVNGHAANGDVVRWTDK